MTVLTIRMFAWPRRTVRWAVSNAPEDRFKGSGGGTGAHLRDWQAASAPLSKHRVWNVAEPRIAFSIKTEEADGLARSLARLTGESPTEAVTTALRERLERERARRGAGKDLSERLRIWGTVC
jgi:hypothetical protein